MDGDGVHTERKCLGRPRALGPGSTNEVSKEYYISRLRLVLHISEKHVRVTGVVKCA